MKLRVFTPLLTYPDASADAAVRAAVAVAGLVGDELHSLALEADIPSVSNALSRALLNLPEMIRDAERLSAENGRRLLALAKAEAEARGVELTTGTARAQPALIGDLVARHARYFDLAVIATTGSEGGARMVAEAVLFGAGRPTMLIPEQAAVQRFGRLAIAWDGSRVAARAVADARMVLQRAEEVTVLTVTDEKPLQEQDAGERLAEGLRRSGVTARFHPVQAEDCPIAETLQRHASQAGADLLVMGGYGHSRLRDFVLGGATQGVLSDLRMPVLLSH